MHQNIELWQHHPPSWGILFTSLVSLERRIIFQVKLKILIGSEICLRLTGGGVAAPNLSAEWRRYYVNNQPSGLKPRKLANLSCIHDTLSVYTGAYWNMNFKPPPQTEPSNAMQFIICTVSGLSRRKKDPFRCSSGALSVSIMVGLPPNGYSFHIQLTRRSLRTNPPLVVMQHSTLKPGVAANRAGYADRIMRE